MLKKPQEYRNHVLCRAYECSQFKREEAIHLKMIFLKDLHKENGEGSSQIALQTSIFKNNNWNISQRFSSKTIQKLKRDIGSIS